MNLSQTILENSHAELELAVLCGKIERELELRRTIAELRAQIEAEYVPVEPLEVYSPHTIVIGAVA